MKNITLLTKFIHDRLSKYTEPARKGVPKGHPIGMSFVKYKASLYMLYDFPLKDIAKDFAISYGLLRKWRTEPDFKEMHKKHCHDFTAMFLVHFKEWHVNNIKNYKNFVKNEPIYKLEMHNLPAIDVREFEDISKYNFELINLITSEFCKIINKGDLALDSDIYLIIRLMKGNNSASKTPKSIQLLIETARQKALRELKKSILEKAINSLKKPSITEQIKREIIIALDSLKQSYE